MDMLNKENVGQVANSIGKCLQIEQEQEMQQQGYIRIKSEVRIGKSLLVDLWWMDTKGEDKWASIKYERLPYFCYGCGTLGQTSLNFNKEIVLSEENNRAPMYGPWLSRSRPSGWNHIGGGKQNQNQARDHTRKTLKEMMREGSNAMIEKNLGTKVPKLE